MKDRGRREERQNEGDKESVEGNQMEKMGEETEGKEEKDTFQNSHWSMGQEKVEGNRGID